MPIRKQQEVEPEYTASSKAIVAHLGSSDLSLDQDLRALRKVMIKPTFRNLEEGFWNDSIAVSFTEITAAVIIGDGLRVRCDKRPEAVEIIKKWNRRINVKRQTIEDFIRNTWYDAIVYGKFFWRVDERTKDFTNVDIQRLDPKSIEIRVDPVMGYRKFIQHVMKYSYHRAKKAFYRQAGKEDNSKIIWSSQWGNTPFDPNQEVLQENYSLYESPEASYRQVKIDLPDEPNVILFGDFFHKPPIANALHYIVYKRWILWFMRKYSQKHWAPFVVLKVGDPGSNTYPSDKHKMQAALDNGQAFIRQITNFGGVSIPGEMDIKTLETQTARSSEIYVLYIRELDKQIMYTIFGSMGQREATGAELATSRQLQEGWLRFVKGIRREYELMLTNFWASVVLPYNGINDVDAMDIEIDYSPLRFETTEELMRSIQLGAMVGLWKDTNEMRKAAQSAFAFLDELPESENTKVEALAKQTQGQNQTSPQTRLMEYHQSRKDRSD
jgi:hypothetical protein